MQRPKATKGNRFPRSILWILSLTGLLAAATALILAANGLDVDDLVLIQVRVG